MYERDVRGYRPVEELAVDYSNTAVRLGFLATFDMVQTGMPGELARDHVTLDYGLNTEIAARILKLVRYDLEMLEAL